MMICSMNSKHLEQINEQKVIFVTHIVLKTTKKQPAKILSPRDIAFRPPSINSSSVDDNLLHDICFVAGFRRPS